MNDRQAISMRKAMGWRTGTRAMPPILRQRASSALTSIVTVNASVNPAPLSVPKTGSKVPEGTAEDLESLDVISAAKTAVQVAAEQTIAASALSQHATYHKRSFPAFPQGGDMTILM